MNNSNFEFQYFKENKGGIGVCDDDMALTDAFLKSRGIASTALVRMYGTQGGLNHTHVVYYEPISKVWKANSNQIRVGSTNPAFSTNWNVYVFRPPVLQHNYFYSQYDNKQTYMIMLDLYYKMMGAASDRVTDMFSKGVPTSVVHEWFLSKS
jgi:hypothetical protein